MVGKFFPNSPVCVPCRGRVKPLQKNGDWAQTVRFPAQSVSCGLNSSFLLNSSSDFDVRWMMGAFGFDAPAQMLLKVMLFLSAPWNLGFSQHQNLAMDEHAK